MKKTTLFVLIGVGIVLFGCTGTPSTVDRLGNARPNLQETPDGAVTPGVMVMEFDSNSFSPRYNPDGTITMFTFNNVRVTILPMTDGRTRGALNRTTQEFDTLITRYTAAIRSNPQDYDSLIMLAGLYIDRGLPGDAELAVRYSDQALAISRDNPEALYARALAYREKGDNASALSDLETILMTNIQSMKGVYYVMGMIYYKEGRAEEALSAFEKVKAIDPDFVDIDEILEFLHK